MDGIGPGVAVFVFLAVASVAMFSMIAVASWSGARQKEREAYYKNDMLKKLAESQGAGAASALELLREEAKITLIRMRMGLKIAGMVVSAAGLGVVILLKGLVTDEPVYLTGVLVLLIGVALFAGSYVVTTRAE
ncbi:MAG TPA: hypothetical protein VHX60_17425 [Acidobacteriaceae bacterium]|jgi:hypothetical protein|nr:hypothetical protein [Acidobacteriaceae bacterium]